MKEILYTSHDYFCIRDDIKYMDEDKIKEVKKALNETIRMNRDCTYLLGDIQILDVQSLGIILRGENLEDLFEFGSSLFPEDDVSRA